MVAQSCDRMEVEDDLHISFCNFKVFKRQTLIGNKKINFLHCTAGEDITSNSLGSNIFHPLQLSYSWGLQTIAPKNRLCFQSTLPI